jgi:hypothetical protein
MRWGATVTVVAALAVGAMGSTATAVSQEQASLAIEPNRASPGVAFTASYRAAAPCAEGSAVRFLWDEGTDRQVVLGTTRLTACRAVLRTAVPASAAAGSHQVSAFASVPPDGPLPASQATAAFLVIAGEGSVPAGGGGGESGGSDEGVATDDAEAGTGGEPGDSPRGSGDGAAAGPNGADGGEAGAGAADDEEPAEARGAGGADDGASGAGPALATAVVAVLVVGTAAVVLAKRRTSRPDTEGRRP